MKIKSEYDAKIDNKKRLTIREANYDYYHVYEYSNGTILLTPRVLVKPDEVSKKTLAMMDKAIKNLESGKVSEEIDLDKYLSITD
jgi:hypothetical protein